MIAYIKKKWFLFIINILIFTKARKMVNQFNNTNLRTRMNQSLELVSIKLVRHNIKDLNLYTISTLNLKEIDKVINKFTIDNINTLTPKQCIIDEYASVTSVSDLVELTNEITSEIINIWSLHK